MSEPPALPVDFVSLKNHDAAHAKALGLQRVEYGTGFAVTKIPYAPHLVGDPETGVIHGGVITSLLDHTSGFAVQTVSRMFGGIATLDLRIDYMKPATPGEDIFAFCECFKSTKTIAFVRGVAYHTDRGDPIAACSAVFMRTGVKQKPATTP
jgi:uncharacterized protein (TIGR00369 family)